MSLLSHYFEEHRPWGSYERFTLNEPTTVKILRVDAGKRFSLQKHEHRGEWWKVIEGDGIAQTDEVERHVTKGDVIESPAGTLHRLTGGDQGIAVLEIAFGTFDENDIVRTEDDFGRG